MKRLFDLVACLMGLIAFAPLILLICACLACASGFPVFFRQERVGMHGKSFVILKFRTMVPLFGAERGRFDAGSTTRVTPIGQWLRKTKLDELPQLWNVLRGEMSIVGPRPEIRQWVDAEPQRWQSVLAVRPGITDPASIEFRNEEEILARAPDPSRCYREEILPRKLDLYEKYVRQHSVCGDLLIIVRTIRAVMRL